MVEKTTYNQFVSCAKQSKRVLVFQEIEDQLITPTSAFINVSRSKPNATLLEFYTQDKPNLGYSFIGIEPLATLTSKTGKTTVQRGEQTETSLSDPINVLRQLRQEFADINTIPMLRLTGGSVGYMSYDAIRLFEDIPDRHNNHNDLPDIFLNFYGTSITFDHEHSKVIVAKIVNVERDLKECYQNAMAAITSIVQQLHSPIAQKKNITKKTDDKFKVDLTDEQFSKLVTKAKEYIKNGDIFQIVLSRTFKKKYNSDAIDIYKTLKKINPSPYHFYIKNSDNIIVGASPEKLVSLDNNLIESKPIAGTRPQKKDSEETIAQELMNDPKEMAEHMMLVDLARNDVGAVAKPGSVKITALNEIIHFSHVMHMESTVQGTLSENYDALDVLKANFPAGTLSGAPKIRAMELIDELENSRRGTYGGAVIALDRTGNLESCIMIRTALIKNGYAYVRAGAGIVHDSNPEQEVQETRHKARSIINAIEMAERGLQ